MSELHQAFVNSGRKPGLEIWRIEDFNPVPVPHNHYGNFYSGDSYIVLKTTETGGNTFSWDIHFWLGSNTSQDEAGTAAILTVNLDDYQFQGAAVQHRETQGHESKHFLSYFQPAIRYLDGGHASGFSHVVINAGTEKRLFHIKGKKHVRVEQVKPSVSAMNKGDCFILDVDHSIFVYVGEKANKMEKMNAITVANNVRDQDHNGRGEIEIVDPYSDEGDFRKFFEALGSGDKNSVPEASAGGDDETFEHGATQEVILSEISDGTGRMKITKHRPPFENTILDTNECYILDLGQSGIYVWVGKQSNEKEKAAAFNTAQKYLKAHNYPDWVHVMKVPEGIEPIVFKQHFNDWN